VAINQQHEGGLEILKTMFGTTAKCADYSVYFLTSPSTTPLTSASFNDSDDALTPVTPELFDANTQGVSSISGITSNQATLHTKIAVVNGVPQITFPQVSVVFSGPLASGNTIYGYCIMNSVAGVSIFRELFKVPTEPAANTELAFIPVFRIGNTAFDLT